MSQTNDVKTPAHFPTFRRWFARLGKLPFLSRAWWKRNARRLAFVGLFVVALWTTANIYATFALNRELNAIKQRGEPLTLAALEPKIPDNENAATVYQKAFKLLRYEEHENSAMLGFDRNQKPLTSQQKFIARERIFSHNRATTQLIFQAVKMPKYQVDIDFSSSENIEKAFKSFSYVREFARFMGAQAEHEANRGNRAQAFRCVAAVYRMTDQVAQEPVVMQMLVGIAMEHIGHAALARVLDVAPLSSNEAQNAAAQLPRSNWDQVLQRAIWNDRAETLKDFQDSSRWWRMMTDSGDGSGEASFWISLRDQFYLDQFLAYTLTPLRKLDTASYLRLDRFEENADIPWFARVTQDVASDVIKTRQNTERATDVRAMARIALALKLWKQTHSNYPKSLSELSAIPIASLPNALKRKTIGYKTQGDKFLLYGFGLNRRDDGGKSNNYDPLNPDSQIFGDDDDDFPWRQSLGVKKPKN